MFQQIAAFIIVALAVVATLYHFYRAYLAAPMASFLLKRGRVKLALKVRGQVQESGCGNCGSDSSSQKTSGSSCRTAR